MHQSKLTLKALPMVATIVALSLLVSCGKKDDSKLA
jgi:major membrane immunogen (membrane-anchored lipoprotein)